MKKYLILLAMLLVAVANYAEKPANYVEASQEAYRASDPLMLEGYFTGDTFVAVRLLYQVLLRLPVNR